MRMFAEEDKGVVFFETVLSLKKQKHTCIECIPVPWEQFDLLPGYFKVRFSNKVRKCKTQGGKKIGIHTGFRGRMVTAQEADRLFCPTRGVQACYGPKFTILHGSI